VKVVVVTTSYPRGPGDAAGVFVRDAVEGVRARGIGVEVVSPATLRHYGIAYGSGIPGNLRHAPWRAAFLPLFIGSLARATRRAARGADLVHAHWLPSGLAARAAPIPFVVQLWGTDVELARRARRPARALLGAARLVICASAALADAAEDLGAQTVRVVPTGVEIPESVPEPAWPPHALYVGRLSEEKGVLDLVEAADGLPLVVVGDGPLRDRVPGAVGFVAPSEVGGYLARAAVVVCPSHREGYGVVARQALAYGRPVVASAVGGLPEVVVDGETGLLVPPRDPPALREALQRLLADEALRTRLGDAGRRLAEERLGQGTAATALVAAYEDALRA
jgi:glycosyltransferase involved in cell wall biosynthesis